MSHCSYCYTYIPKPTSEQKYGPKLVYCNRKCYVFNFLKKYPGADIDLRQGYPDWANEYDKKEAEINERTVRA